MFDIQSNMYDYLLKRTHPRAPILNTTLKQYVTNAWLNVYNHTLERSEYFSYEHMRALQEIRLMHILKRARETVPFYKTYLKNVKTLDDFYTLPPLTKQTMRHALETGQICNKALEMYRVPRSTSGSSGVPFVFYHDSNMYVRRRAFYHRLLRFAGYKEGDTPVWIMREPHPQSGAVPFVCSGPHDIERRKESLYTLLTGKTVVLHAMASHLIFLADLFAKDKKVFDFRSVISYGESLYPEMRRHLETQFNAPLFDYYASQEALTHGQECEFHDGFHINSEWVYVEVVGKNHEPLPPGEKGSVVVTSFDNEYMPFIRYELGDIGFWVKEACPCGRTLPRIKLCGRHLSYFIHPNGTVGDFASLALPVLQMTPQVLAFQIIRNTQFSYTIRIVPSPQFNSGSKQFILSNMKEYLGPTCTVTITTVDEIEREPGGKHRVFVNQVNDLATLKHVQTQKP